MKSATRKRALLQILPSFGLAISIAVAGGSAFVTGNAGAQQDEQALSAQKAEWQARYRMLLRNAAILRDNAIRSRKYYAQAQRRNYPRGGARQQFRIDEENAIKELAEIEAEIEQLFSDARRAGIPRVWFWEVDDETIAPAAPADGETTDDREGRNPLYLDDEKDDF